MPRTTPVKRARISVLLEEGYSTREIAAHEGTSRTTVSNIRQDEENDPTNSSRENMGRPRKLSRRDENRLCRRMATGECKNAVKAQELWNETAKQSISENTVRRTLHRNYFVARVRRKSPLLTKKHRLRRLQFARKYKDWTIEDWSHVIFSDECQIRIFGDERREWYWKRRDEPLQERHIQPVVKHGGGSIMMWGCMTSPYKMSF
ncbi:uncharacterized protein VTP21DRAFT_8033 [Calcarisporiella thermophila]|uniref:uncharacterized protein n=1 Tax=Calcarisporiella thermophila TaxID=911321 RepID=UPI003742A1F5